MRSPGLRPGLFSRIIRLARAANGMPVRILAPVLSLMQVKAPKGWYRYWFPMMQLAPETRFYLILRRKLVMMLSAAAFVCGLAQAGPATALDDFNRPTLSELMTTTQLRHFKLSYAGRVKNWDLAQYELGKMRETFAMAAQLYPLFQTVEQAKLIAQMSQPPLQALEKAIQQKDRPAFKQAFRALTDACNSCHSAAGLGFIAIRVPTSSPFSDQSVFPPP
jgi:mono/diheme cytochrome c family protein